jgi:hypothetical protein
MSSLRDQLLTDAVAPPIVACLFWLMSRGWVITVNSGETLKETIKWPNRMFLPVLALLYAMMFGMTAYFHFFP